MDLKTRISSAINIPLGDIWEAGDVVAIHPSHRAALLEYVDSHQQAQYRAFLDRNMRLSARWFGYSRSLAVLHLGDLPPEMDYKAVVPCYPVFSMGGWVDVDVETLGIGYATTMNTTSCFNGTGGLVLDGNINRCYDYVLVGEERARPNPSFQSEAATPNARPFVWSGTTRLTARRYEFRGLPAGSPCDVKFGSHLLLSPQSSIDAPGLEPKADMRARAFSTQLLNTEFGLPDSDWRDLSAAKYQALIPTRLGIHGRRNWIVVDGPALASFGVIDSDGSTIVGATRKHIAAHIKDAAALIPNCHYDAARFARVQANLLRDPDGLMVAVSGFADVLPWLFSSKLRPHSDAIEQHLDTELANGTRASLLKARWVASDVPYKLGLQSPLQPQFSLAADVTLPAGPAVILTVTEEGLVMCTNEPVTGLTLDTLEEFMLMCLLANKELTVNYTHDFALSTPIEIARDAEQRVRTIVADLNRDGSADAALYMPIKRQLDIGDAVFATTFIDQVAENATLELPLALLSPGYLRKSLLPRSAAPSTTP